MDEAVICPKCGCPTGPVPGSGDHAAKLLRADKKSKITAAAVLNIIAFGLSLVACLIVIFTGHQSGNEPPDGSYTIEKDLVGELFGYDTTKIITPDEKMQTWLEEEAERKEFNQRLIGNVILWQGLSVAALVLGLVAGRQAKKGKKGLTIAFMCVSVLGPVALFLRQPEVIVLLICGIGLILLIPTILNLIAGAKLLQAAGIHE